jgi:hypothetical protein
VAMAVNLDADVGQIIRNFLNKKGKKTDPKTGKVESASFATAYYKQAGVKCIIVFCITAILAWVISYVTKSSVVREQSEFASLSELEPAVVKIEQDIASSKDLLAKNSKKVEEIMPMFSDIEGSKSLFKLISVLAEKNNLIIKNLSQGEIIETTSPAKFLQTKILLEVEGFYPNYVKFLNELDQSKPLIRVGSEDLKLFVSAAGERKLNVTLDFIDYSVEKQEYEKVLQN